MKTALLLIDFQNDYFPGGKFPLWNPEAALAEAKVLIAQAQTNGDLVVFVQHVAAATNGQAPFFNRGTVGVEIHPELLAAAPLAPVVIKQHADAFHKTTLEEILAAQGVEALKLCGMMTQNCVTHTALSKAAEKYQVTILAKACTTVSQILHAIALNAVSTRSELRVA